MEEAQYLQQPTQTKSSNKKIIIFSLLIIGIIIIVVIVVIGLLIFRRIKAGDRVKLPDWKTPVTVLGTKKYREEDGTQGCVP